MARFSPADLREAAGIPKGEARGGFLLAVLRETARIPRGETRTYKQIAVAIGRPRACRAVGTALGKNPFPLRIPCHRVVRKGGGLGGYRWGIERKRSLLEAERASHD
jgi:AraC family transcriptional regulator of adaptative response/methylated-DNA-[protein]-cysteine methyltransferase